MPKKMNRLSISILILYLFSSYIYTPIAQTSLTYGESITGEISVEGEEDTFSFCGQAGDYVIIRLNSEEFSFARVELYDSGGTQLAVANSVIVARIEFNLPVNDEYNIIVKTINGDEIGAYSITLSVLNPPGATPLTSSTALNASLDFTTAMDAYTISLSAGSHIQFFLNSDDMNFPRLELFDEQGNLIASDLSVFTVQIDEFVSMDGCYTLYVMSQNGDEGGNYSLSFLLISGSYTNDCPPRPPCIINTPNTATINIGEGNGLSGDTLTLPVTIQNCNNIASFQGSLAVENADLVELLDLVPGVIEPIFNLNNQTFSFFDQEGGQSISNNDTLFYLLVVLNGSPGDSSQVFLNDMPLFVQLSCILEGQPNIVSILQNDGLVYINQNVTISGMIETCELEPVNLVEVTLSGTDPAGHLIDLSMTTGPDGFYQFENIPAGSFLTIRPAKDINYANGLSSFGLFQGQQFILNVNVPQIYSPYQILAGNANCNNSFSSIDLLVIQRVLVGIMDNFGGCPSWQFVTADHTFPIPFTVTNVFPFPQQWEVNQITNNTVVDFVGVKIGDILKEANPQNLTEGVSDGSGTGTLDLIYHLSNAQAGDVIEIPFWLAQAQELASLQMALSFDTQKLKWIDFQSDHYDLHSMLVGQPSKQDNILKFSWFSASGYAVPLSPETPLFYLKFEVLSDLDTANSPFAIERDFMNPVARYANGYALDIQIEKAILNNDISTDVGYFNVFQNIPNPCKNQTIIPFEMAKSAELTLSIFDQTGKTIHQIRKPFPAGQSDFLINTTAWESGVYYYRISTNGFSEIRPMIVLR